MHLKKPNIFFLCGPAVAGETSAMLSVEMLLFLYDFFLHFVSPFDLAQGKSFGHSDLAIAAAPVLGIQS